VVSLNSWTLVLIVLVVVFALALIVRLVVTGRRQTRGLGKRESVVEGAYARLEEGESVGTLAAEQVEEVVKRRLSQYPDLAGKPLDLSTAPDGALQVEFDGVRYGTPAEIPDERVRAAVEGVLSDGRLTLNRLGQARVEPGERAATLVAEQIEELVRRRLAQDASMANLALDFATAADGSLEIWVGGVLYRSSEEIPDERVRKAIAEAVEEFNR